MSLRIAACCCAWLAAACATPVVKTDRLASADASLDFVVVVRIEPGRRERQHEVFVGIGKRGENPAQRYLHAEYTYLLSGKLDWRIRWESPERVHLELLEDARPIAAMTFVRDRESGRFGELAGEGGWRKEAV